VSDDVHPSTSRRFRKTLVGDLLDAIGDLRGCEPSACPPLRRLVVVKPGTVPFGSPSNALRSQPRAREISWYAISAKFACTAFSEVHRTRAGRSVRRAAVRKMA